MEKLRAFQSHPSEDLLEEYAFHRLGNEKSASLEEHLLVCVECQNALTEIEEYALLMKTETARLERSPLHAWLLGLRRAVWPTSPWPRVAWTTTAAMACLILVLYLNSRPMGPAVQVALISLRGTVDFPHVPPRRPLDLHISDEDPGKSAIYSLEIVEASSGKQVWAGELKRLNLELHAQIPRGVPKGRYWVRLYGQSELLEEFGLRAE